MSLLKNIKGAFSGSGFSLPTVGKSSKSVAGIDIGSSSIKIVQLKEVDGSAVLETYGSITLGPYDKKETGRVTQLSPVKIAEALTDLIRETNITTDTVSVSIPFSASLTTIMTMPNMPEDQLKKMIPVEARKYIPMSTKEVSMDWYVIPQEQALSHAEMIHNVHDTPVKKQASSTLDILLVAIHNSTLNAFQQAMDSSNLNVQFYELEIFSAGRGALGHGVMPIMLVDIGASATKIYVVEHGIVRMSHLVHKGSQDLTLHIARSLNISFEEAESLKHEDGLSEKGKTGQVMQSVFEYIINETNRVTMAYGKKHHKNIAKTIFCGATVGMPGFMEYVTGRVNNSVEVANPFSKILTPAFLNDVLDQVGPEFTVATGLALRQLQK